MDNSSGQAKMSDFSSIVRFLKSGKATFTIKDTKNDKAWTYRARKMKDKEDGFFIHLKIDGKFSYIGMLWINTKNGIDQLKVVYGKEKSAVLISDSGYQTISAVIYCISNKYTLSFNEFWHDGNCGRCGRTLTNPDSLATGIGPECIKK